MFRSKPVLPFSLLIIFLTTVEPKCPKTCDLALASYNVWYGATLTFISEDVFAQPIDEILRYNPQITDQNHILAGSRINVPFTCDCIDGEFLGHVFLYTVPSGNDTYDVIAEKDYANLTTAAWLEGLNVYRTGQIPANVVVNVTVNCSCGDAAVSTAYGLFVTYPLEVGDSLESIAVTENISEAILQMYNPGVDFNAGSGLVYIPGKDASGNYPPLNGTGAGPSLAPIPDESGNNPPLKSGTGFLANFAAGLSGGAIAGIAIGVVLMGALLVAVCIKWGFYRRKKVPGKPSSLKRDEEQSLRSGKGGESQLPNQPQGPSDGDENVNIRDGESQLPNQPPGPSDGDKNANIRGSVSTGDMKVGNNIININLVNPNTGGG